MVFIQHLRNVEIKQITTTVQAITWQFDLSFLWMHDCHAIKFFGFHSEDRKKQITNDGLSQFLKFTSWLTLRHITLSLLMVAKKTKKTKGKCLLAHVIYPIIIYLSMYK